MSSLTRVSRSSFQAAQRVAPRLRNSRIQVRRGFASAHGEAKKTSEAPWGLMAAGITLPGVYLLWPRKSSHGGGHHGDHEAKHDETEEHAEKDTDDEEPKPGSKDEQGKFAPETTSPDGGDKKTIDQSQENQSAKLTDKPASKRVDPTEK
ncbi:hypothetical protein V8F20_002636 [Naviculisporaceae sp. PSN 640]